MFKLISSHDMIFKNFGMTSPVLWTTWIIVQHWGVPSKQIIQNIFSFLASGPPAHIQFKSQIPTTTISNISHSHTHTY